MKIFEWTDDIEAMTMALLCFNKILLSVPFLEETARNEAKVVQKRLNKGDLSKEELVDYLHQAAVDFRTEIIPIIKTDPKSIQFLKNLK